MKFPCSFFCLRLTALALFLCLGWPLAARPATHKSPPYPWQWPIKSHETLSVSFDGPSVWKKIPRRDKAKIHTYYDLINYVLANIRLKPPTVAEIMASVAQNQDAPAYRDYWPRLIPIDLEPVTDSSGTTLSKNDVMFIDGPKYWKSLPIATRKSLKTIGDLQRYCQDHEGAG